ncbi:MAG: LEPR-XLL domain-containing protein, partial [Betaproteobacteria bacterium]|nr:LEPR-XLL domain-containing protein [Betaproteobacteria bacterium]
MAEWRKRGEFSRSRRARQRRAMRLETLEPRLLLSADVAGTLDIPGETDRYTFSLDRDTQLYFDALSADPSISWSLSGPRGAEVSGRGFAFSDSAGIGENPVLDLRAGDYTLTVDGLQEATGAYAFRLLDVQAEAVGITPGVVVAGTLDPGNETDAYVFSAAAGDRFYFDAQDVSGSAYWRLL